MSMWSAKPCSSGHSPYLSLVCLLVSYRCLALHIQGGWLVFFESDWLGFWGWSPPPPLGWGTQKSGTQGAGESFWVYFFLAFNRKSDSNLDPRIQVVNYWFFSESDRLVLREWKVTPPVSNGMADASLWDCIYLIMFEMVKMCMSRFGMHRLGLDVNAQKKKLLGPLWAQMPL